MSESSESSEQGGLDKPLGDKDHCSTCNQPPNNIYGVIKLHPILPCYTIYHYLCQKCVTTHRSKKCIIEPYDSPEFNFDDDSSHY